jgi:vacuolar-type H+-ATPase subunit I/STV1
MPLMQLGVIRERVHALQQEISSLRAENARYLSMHLHSALEAREHRLREVRLQEIVEELGRLTKTKIL